MQNIEQVLEMAPKHCDACGTRYDKRDFTVLKTMGMGTTFAVKCNKCNNSFIINFVTQQPGVVGAQKMHLSFDTTSNQELQYFTSKSTITYDDAMDMYNSLPIKSTKKDFTELYYHIQSRYIR